MRGRGPGGNGADADSYPDAGRIDSKRDRWAFVVGPGGSGATGVPTGADGKEHRRHFQLDATGVGVDRRIFAFSPDGRLLAVGMGTGLIRLFDSRTGEENARWPAHEGSLATLTFSPDGRLLASGAGDGSAKLWEPGTGRLLYTMDVGARTALIVAFSPDGQLLATGSSQGQVRLWDPEKGRELRTLEARMNARDGIAFSPGVRLLASGGGQGAIKLWGTEGRSCFPSRVIETQLTGSLSVRMGSCWPVPAMTR